MNSFAKYRLLGGFNSTISGKLLLLLLLESVDEKGKVCLSQRKVSEALGISQTTVQRNFRRLQRSGYIDIIPQYHDDGGRAANQFVILG